MCYYQNRVLPQLCSTWHLGGSFLSYGATFQEVLEEAPLHLQSMATTIETCLPLQRAGWSLRGRENAEPCILHYGHPDNAARDSWCAQDAEEAVRQGGRQAGRQARAGGAGAGLGVNGAPVMNVGSRIFIQ